MEDNDSLRKKIGNDLHADMVLHEKYSNDPRMIIFDKEQLLAIIDEQKVAIRARDEALIHQEVVIKSLGKDKV